MATGCFLAIGDAGPLAAQFLGGVNSGAAAAERAEKQIAGIAADVVEHSGAIYAWLPLSMDLNKRSAASFASFRPAASPHLKCLNTDSTLPFSPMVSERLLARNRELYRLKT